MRQQLESTLIRLTMQYSCEVIKTVRVTEATCSTDAPVLGRAITRYASLVALTEPTETLLMY